MIFNFVLESTVIGSLIFLLISILQKILKDKITPVFFYYLWSVIFVKFLIPLDIKSNFSIEKIIKGWNFQEQVTVEAIPIIINNATIMEQNIFRNNISWNKIWLIGVCIVACCYLIKYLFLQKEISRCKKVNERNILEILTRLKGELSISRNIELLESNFISSPAITGFWKPKILLPKDFYKKTSRGSLELVFTHELMHLKYGDIIINLFLEVIKILYFFNPLIYIIAKKIRSDCEVACDYRVLKYIGKDYCKSYGNVLIKLASDTKINSKFEFGFNAMENKRELERRIIMIGKNTKFGKKQVIAGISTLILVGAVGLTTYADDKDTKKTNGNKGEIEVLTGDNGSTDLNNEKLVDKSAIVKIDNQTGKVLAVDSITNKSNKGTLNLESGVTIITDENSSNMSIEDVKRQLEVMLKESGREGKIENLVKNKNNFTYDIIKNDGTVIKEEVAIISLN
ncbi:MAG: M56 family metallopeptidase [Sarcina sp.]